MRRWFRDTLFLRLFLLMWAALVASHIAAFGIVTSGFLFDGRRSGPGEMRRLPIFPSLPPTPGFRERPGMPSGRPAPGGAWSADGLEFGNGPLAPPPAPFRGLPVHLLALDYAIRLLLIGAAAAIGARWVAGPVRRLVSAASSLSRSVGNGPGPTPLDETTGTVEVREAARVFNRMARDLDAQFRARALMLAALSHDLKTPLTRMRMRAEADADSAAADRSAADIREMSALIDNALDVFRASASEEAAQAIDVAALLQSMVDDRAELGQPVTLATAPAVAIAGPVALRRTVANLLDNALRYGGETTVSVGRAGAQVRVGIDDRGPGIPEPLLEAVFQPFYRVDSSRHRGTGGTGLGLYIARDLAQKQGGTLTLRNRDGGGLSAELLVPAAAA